MNCKICNSQTEKIFREKVLKKYDVHYYKCTSCDYIFTEEPYWLEEAYKNPINNSDTGLISRNNYFAKVTAGLIFLHFGKNGKFLDYAGGYGIFTRLMRDIGFDFYWSDQYTENIFAQGFDKESANFSKFDLLTVFECFEHFSNPVAEIEKMKNLSGNILFSTELTGTAIPDRKQWWYYGFDHGQHLSFYSYKTLTEIAKKTGLNLYKVNSLFLFSAAKITPAKIALISFLNKIGINVVVKKLINSKTFEDFVKSRDEMNG